MAAKKQADNLDLAGESPALQKSGKNPGIFPSGVGGKKPAEEAVARKLVEQAGSLPPAKKGGKVTPLYRITNLGRQFVFDHDSPKQALEALGSALKQVGEAYRKAMQSQVEELARLQQTMQGVEQVVERASQQQSALPPMPTAPPPADDTWLEEVEPYLQARSERVVAGDCPLPELYDFLRQQHSELSIGHYHDGLRRLHNEVRIRLSTWSGPLENLPQPNLAMFVAHRVMYYVRLP